MINLDTVAVKALAGCLALSVGAFLYQRGESWKQTAQFAAAELERVVSAAQSSQDALLACDAATTELMTVAKAQQQALIAAGDRMQGMATELAASRKKLFEVEQRDRYNPECAALLEVDFVSMCPGHALGVRQRAADSLPHADDSHPRADPTALRRTTDI